MKSKLLQKKSYGLNQSHGGMNGQQESIEDSSVPWWERENPPGRVSPTTGSPQGLPSVVKHACRRQHLLR
jgi:hypothetical protein